MPQVGFSMRRFVFAFLSALPAIATNVLSADTTVLRQVAREWFDERDRWAFTQFVREYGDEGVRQERLERYDPSRGFASRWELISIDGQPPTRQQLHDWDRRKNRKSRRPRPAISENLDFDRAKIVEETAQIVRYELPLRSSVEWLFPISKIELIVTIDKTGPVPALEQVQAQIAEPFRVAMGLARVLDIDLDVQMEPPPSPSPAEAKPSGTAQAVVSRFGHRIEYFWSDFKRVPTPLNP